MKYNTSHCELLTASQVVGQIKLKATVIVPTYRRFEPLLDTVSDLLSQRDAEYEVIVVDQNTEWPENLVLDKDCLQNNSKIKWFEHFPPGVVNARNHAVRHASGDVIIFVDDDVRIESETFIANHLALYQNPSVDAVTGAELYLNTKELDAFRSSNIESTEVSTSDKLWEKLSPLEQVLTFPRNIMETVLVCSFCTCNASIRRIAFNKVGGFDKAFIGNSYGDDYDLAIRLWKTGSRILYSPNPWLIHLQVPSGGLRMKDKKNQSSEFERAASSALFFFRHATFQWSWHLLYHHLLRKTVFRKDNVIHPWRQPAAWLGLFQAFIYAYPRRRAVPRLSQMQLANQK